MWRLGRKCGKIDNRLGFWWEGRISSMNYESNDNSGYNSNDNFGYNSNYDPNYDSNYDLNYDSMYREKSPVLIPSFKFEKKTGAFNRYLLPFVAFISMFTVSVFIGGFVVAFFSSFLNLPVLHSLGYIFVPIAAFVFSIGLQIRFLQLLLTAYKIEGNRIICARIVRGRKADGLRGKIPDMVVAVLIGPQLRGWIRLVRLNLRPGFAEQYFDTELYAKKEYLNPRLMKETKHEIVYLCENNKTLRIPKIYEGLCRTEGKERKSFGVRIVLVSILVFLAALAIAVTDLAISRNKTVNEYEPKIEETKEEMQTELADYGYEQERSSVTSSTFRKKVGDRYSEVRYTYDKNGKIKKVDVQLYFKADSVGYEEEIRAVVATMNAGFDEKELDEFIEAVGKILGGEYAHYRLKSEKCILTLGTSGEYVDIH